MQAYQESRVAQGYRGPSEGYMLDPLHIYMDSFKGVIANFQPEASATPPTPAPITTPDTGFATPTPTPTPQQCGGPIYGVGNTPTGVLRLIFPQGDPADFSQGCYGGYPFQAAISLVTLWRLKQISGNHKQ